MHYRGRTLGFSLDDEFHAAVAARQLERSAGRFYELSFHHANIGNHHAGVNIVSPVPVISIMAEARMSLPWQGWKIDLAGRLQDDQPRPHKGFAAGAEIALRAPLAWSLQSGHQERRSRRHAQAISQRKQEGVGFDFEHIAGLRLDARAEGQGRGAEEMHMHVARPAEAFIFEMMRLQIGDAVAHIVFARQEGLVEDDLRCRGARASGR